MPISAPADAPVAHRGTPALQRLIEFAPCTGGLALWARHRDVDAADAAPVSTDGHTLSYHPGFEALPLAAQTGWVAHEVLHLALRHAQRFLALQAVLGDVDLALYNTCADAIVNSALGHLGWLSLAPGAVTLEALLGATLTPPASAEAALLAWDVESLYRALDDRDGRSRRDGPRASRARALGRQTATDLRPAAGTESAPGVESEAARDWRERLQRAHAGDGEFSLLRTLLADLPHSRTPWEQVLRTRLARGLAQRPTLSWSRPSRSYIAHRGRAGPGHRMPWEPGLSGQRPVPRLALIVDVSGSVDDALMARFAREVEALTRRLEAALVLIVGDDAVRHVEQYAPGLARLPGIALRGGGGTDFEPLLAEAGRHRPDIAVVLTDLEGPAGPRPRWPVLWAVPPASAAAVPPFGRLLVLR
jgi:hypothetical protein